MTIRTVAAIAMLGALGLSAAFLWFDQQGHTSIARAKRLLWEEVYADGGETIYCGARFQRKEDLDGHSVEHIVPRTVLKSSLCLVPGWSCSRYQRAASDLRNLRPELARVNSARGARPFGELEGETRRQPWADCPDFEIARDGSGSLVEPRDEAKGEIARAVLYMRRTYGVRFSDQDLMARWDRAYPATDEERRRNAIMESLD